MKMQMFIQVVAYIIIRTVTYTESTLLNIKYEADFVPEFFIVSCLIYWQDFCAITD